MKSWHDIASSSFTTKAIIGKFFFSLNGQNARHLGITKMTPEARQYYYYLGLTKHFRQWVIYCQDCIELKLIGNLQLKTP